MSDVFNLRKDSPLRPPNWRWERAILLAKGRLRGFPRRNEDEQTLAAVKFQQALDRCANDADRQLVGLRNPAIWDAYQLRRPAGNVDGNLQRYMLEARLLTQEPYESISEKTAVSPTAVGWYEHLFFNVRDRLRASDYIMANVIGPQVYTGLTEREYDVLWKVFGYIYGPRVLDSFINQTTRRELVGDDDDVETRYERDTAASMRRKAAVCARTYTINGFTQEGLMNIYLRFLELENAKDKGGVEKDNFMQTINVVLAGLPWSNGDGIVRPDLKAARPLDMPLLEYYDQGQAELRTDELLRVSNGADLPDRAALQDMRFPEPANANPPTQ